VSARVSPAEALRRIQDVAARRAGTVWIGIDGFGGSGKTTFAARVAAEVPDTSVVHIDDFAAPSVPGWDWDRFRAQVLLPLQDGRPACYQRWDWDTDRGAEWHEIPVGGPVVVEGVSATRREVGAPWAVTVWIDAPRDLRLARAVERDGAARLERWLTDWMPSEDAWAARERPLDYIDLIVSGI
jgi:uridine kinase